MELEITKMLTISTAHITEETNRLLCDGEVEAAYYALDGGWLVLSYGPDDSVPKDLEACLALAEENGCEWLRLDRDGQIVDGLEVFDW